jgi:hypothetical protein
MTEQSSLAPNASLHSADQTPSCHPVTGLRHAVPSKIISGGQTGADRAALDFAIEIGLTHGGYCPKGRIAEDGRIPEKYLLTEHKSSRYPERTRANVEAAGLTVIFSKLPLSKGSQLTVDCCRRAHKPFVVLSHFPAFEADASELRHQLATFKGILNVAGSRESSCPGMHAHVLNVLRQVIQPK